MFFLKENECTCRNDIKLGHPGLSKLVKKPEKFIGHHHLCLTHLSIYGNTKASKHFLLFSIKNFIKWPGCTSVVLFKKPEFFVFFFFGHVELVSLVTSRLFNSLKALKEYQSKALHLRLHDR